MAYLLPHLRTGWAVDQAIVNEEDRVVVIRFGHDSDPTCMIQDEVLCGIAESVKNFGVIYVVDITEVPEFSEMYELYDDCTTMFFYRNKHIMIDLGTGNNNKVRLRTSKRTREGSRAFWPARSDRRVLSSATF